MKVASFLIVLLTMVLISPWGNKAGAIVAVNESRLQQKDEVVTGVYEGNQHQTINMLLNDGTRRAYPFRSDKSLLKRISKTSLYTRVRITVEKGIAVRFEEASK
jgi:hypothetical protein